MSMEALKIQEKLEKQNSPIESPTLPKIELKIGILNSTFTFKAFECLCQTCS